jgi:hypothetical protein
MTDGWDNNIYRSKKKSTFLFSPRDISIEDDAYHGSKDSRFTEWWYFDAVLNNGYSVQMSVRVLSIMKNKLVLVPQRLDIYKDGKLLKHNKKRCPYRKFEPSKDKPLVKLYGKNAIEGRIDEKSGKLIYDLCFEIYDDYAKLRFEGITKGWKGKNPGGDWWAVVLPRANVTGKIRVNNKEIEVKGTGYHDHNWGVKGSAMKNHGWFWGKINTENYSITWATIYKTRDYGQPLLVINEKKGGYINVKPENIDFIGKDLKQNNKKEIPHTFILKAKDKVIDLNFEMKVLDIHHVKMMLIMNYWRFHVLCNGYININSKKEKIKETHIAEFLRFK